MTATDAAITAINTTAAAQPIPATATLDKTRWPSELADGGERGEGGDGGGGEAGGGAGAVEQVFLFLGTTCWRPLQAL